ncbi:MAG: hypothetical protein ABGY75_12200, partial [Gemmataceae bacterium]
YDLSSVMFIATANIADPIPPPLRDRMEILEIPGYTRREKLAIARRHLLPKQLDEHGLDAEILDVRDPALEQIIDRYTREAGVRSLERQIAAVVRGMAVKVAEGSKEPRVVENVDDVAEFFATQARNLNSGCRTLAGLTGDWRAISELAQTCLDWFKCENVVGMRRAARRRHLIPQF